MEDNIVLGVQALRELVKSLKNKQRFADEAKVSLKTVYRFIEGENISLENFLSIAKSSVLAKYRIKIEELQRLGIFVFTSDDAIHATESQAELLGLLHNDNYASAMEIVTKMMIEHERKTQADSEENAKVVD